MLSPHHPQLLSSTCVLDSGRLLPPQLYLPCIPSSTHLFAIPLSTRCLVLPVYKTRTLGARRGKNKTKNPSWAPLPAPATISFLSPLTAEFPEGVRFPAPLHPLTFQNSSNIASPLRHTALDKATKDLPVCLPHHTKLRKGREWTVLLLCCISKT